MELNKKISKSKSYFLEEINFDINDILTFTFNIDNLKVFLTTLLKNQTLLSKKILQIEKKLKLKDSSQPPDSKSTRSKFAKSVKGHFNLNNLKKANQQTIQPISRLDSKNIEEKNILNKIDEQSNKKEIITDKNILDEIKEDKKLENENIKDIIPNGKEENKEYKEDKENKEDKDNIINQNKTENEKINEIASKIKDNNENEELYSNNENENDEYDEDLYSNKENDDINLKINEKNKIKNIHDMSSKEDNLEDNEENNETDLVMNNYELFEINNKIKSLEKKIKNLELLNKVNKFTSNIEDKSEDIQMLKMMIKDLKSENRNIKQENDDIKKKIEDINVKLTDINIFDIFKDYQMEEGSVDAAKALVISLEQKFFKKTALMDERDKKLISDFLDLKNSLQNVINKNGVIEHNINEVRNNFKNLGELVSKSNNDNINSINTFEKKMNNVYKELFNKYDEKNSKIESNIKKINDKILNLEKFKKENMNINNINNNNLELNEETLKFLSTLNNRINEIENKMNTFMELAELNPTKEDIEKLEKEISNKSNIKDYYDLKEKYNLQLAKTNNLEEYLERLQDVSEKKSSEIMFYTKKVENLTANLVTMRAQIETLSNKEENKLLDLSRFLEKIAFNKFLLSTQTEKKKIDNNFEEIRKIINEISEIVKTKCNSEDLKIFENIMNNKIEELKLINSKRFADKVDTNKSMKYLDTQIRHIIDVYIKRLDKNDSWLIAKKPIGGFSCASCESYLGELKNKENYLPWNKYPQREKDQNYRVGNGFSRMLNMLNVELKNNEINSIEKEFESDDDIIKNSEEDRFKMRIKNSPNSQRDIFKDKINKINSKINISNNVNKSNILPKIYINKNEDSSTVSMNNNIEIGIETSMGGHNMEDNIYKENKEANDQQPHIVKIIKKSRLTSVDTSRTERPGTYHIK